MSNKLLTQNEYETLFHRWKRDHGVLSAKEYGGGKRYYQVPNNVDERAEAYYKLIHALVVDHQYKEEDVRATQCFDKIVDTSVWNEHADKKKLKFWRERAADDLKDAIDAYFKVQMSTPEEIPSDIKKKNKIQERIRSRSPDEIGPDADLLDKSTLQGPGVASDIDESIDIFAGDSND
jgi:hypothetical protein